MNTRMWKGAARNVRAIWEAMGEAPALIPVSVPVMKSLAVILGVTIAMAGSAIDVPVYAQGRPSGSSSNAHVQAGDSVLYAKAQRMVSDGDAAASRALIDSLLGVVPSGTPRYAEGLYWKARLTASAPEAERSYRQIVVDYPLSPRVDDALLRMGQLELTRGDRDAALQHFQRLTQEHPESVLRPKASYWAARALFEKNDVSHACAANADALAHALPSDVELRNQIEYQNQQCRGVTVATAPVPATPVTPAAPAKPVVVKSVPAATVPAKPAVKEPSKPEGPSTEAAGYAVQVAAYYDRTQADAFAAKLKRRGYMAHVDGTVAPFRVRIGHYATHAQAATALANLKAKKINGFVAQVQ